MKLISIPAVLKERQRCTHLHTLTRALQHQRNAPASILSTKIIYRAHNYICVCIRIDQNLKTELWVQPLLLTSGCNRVMDLTEKNYRNTCATRTKLHNVVSILKWGFRYVIQRIIFNSKQSYLESRKIQQHTTVWLSFYLTPTHSTLKHWSKNTTLNVSQIIPRICDHGDVMEPGKLYNCVNYHGCNWTCGKTQPFILR